MKNTDAILVLGNLRSKRKEITPYLPQGSLLFIRDTPLGNLVKQHAQRIGAPMLGIPCQHEDPERVIKLYERLIYQANKTLILYAVMDDATAYAIGYAKAKGKLLFAKRL